MKLPTNQEVERLGEGYRGLIDFMHQTELDSYSLMGILFKAAMGLAVTADYDRDEVMAVVMATYDMERFMRPKSNEVH
jgi:uncharacterized protein Smg (DUF494 family)